MSKQWILEDFSAALEQLGSALAEPADSDIVKAGCIQYFEFSFELAWKAIKMFASEFGLEECLSPKSCLRQAFTQDWIEDEAIWLEMLDARNRMAHTYDARKALEIYQSLPAFHVAMQGLLQTLRGIGGEEQNAR